MDTMNVVIHLVEAAIIIGEGIYLLMLHGDKKKLIADAAFADEETERVYTENAALRKEAEAAAAALRVAETRVKELEESLIAKSASEALRLDTMGKVANPKRRTT